MMLEAVRGAHLNSGVRLLPMWERMSKYRVLINGENFLLNSEGRPQKLGFYVTRFVDARDAEDAENAAVALIREDVALQGLVLNNRDDPPMLYAEEVEELEAYDSKENVDTGFSWFTDGEA
jgi:hypothetical protein